MLIRVSSIRKAVTSSCILVAKASGDLLAVPFACMYGNRDPYYREVESRPVCTDTLCMAEHIPTNLSTQ